jgi:hypothetical protein
MNVKTTLVVFAKAFRQIRKKTPVRLVFFIIVAGLFLTSNWTASEHVDKTTELSALLLRTLIFVFVAVVLITAASLTLSYIMYIKAEARPEVKFYTDNGTLCEVNVAKVLYPFAGTLKAELSFDKKDSVLILCRRKKDRQARGAKKLCLPDIRNYQLDSVTLLFQDVFRLFSLRKTFRFNMKVTILPDTGEATRLQSLPRAYSDDETLSDTVHFREGELLNFKHFESSDDIRRIVWQMYAKNRELIVRTAEMHNLYASKIDMYASFQQGFNLSDKNLSGILLNRYKEKVWTVYKALSAEHEVRLATEQKAGEDDKQAVGAQISGLDWHTGDAVYPVNPNISVCCVSALTPCAQVEHLLNSIHSGVLLVFATFADNIGAIDFRNILWNIFTIDKRRTSLRWLLSGARRKIVANRKNIRQLIDKQSINCVEI